MFGFCSTNVRLLFDLCSTIIVVMDDELAAFIQGAPPGRRARKLERYAKLVLGSYDLGWTYRAIAAQLRRKHRLSVVPSTVWEFIHQHRPDAAPPSDAPAITAPTPTNPPVPVQTETPSPPTAPEPAPASPPLPKPSRKPRFNLDA
jgi:hypothetical protein